MQHASAHVGNFEESSRASTIKAPLQRFNDGREAAGCLRRSHARVSSSSISTRLSSMARRATARIIEGNFPVGEFLVGFMPLARDENDVAGARELNGFPDGFGPVGNFLVPVGSKAGSHFGENLRRVFAAGVVGGEDGPVGGLLGGGGHERTLGAVAVAAASEDGDETIRLEFSERPQHIAQGVLGVRIIHENLEAALGGDAFQATGNLRGIGDRGDGGAKFHAH